MKYLNHTTLQTGHNRRSPCDEVSAETVSWLRPWLDAALRNGGVSPLPEPSLAHYSASAHLEQGGMVMTVYAAAEALVTFSVAARSRQSAPLWAYMIAQHGPAKAVEPDAPWLAVALRPGLADHPSTMEWLGDFERCIAWTWIS